MGMTIAEKILASHTVDGKKEIEPGEFLELKVDRVMVHDFTGPAAIGVAEKLLREAEKRGKKCSISPELPVLISDHYVITQDGISLANHDTLGDFARKHGLQYAYLAAKDFGGDPAKVGPSYRGVCHAMTAEEGLWLPGELFVGADSHTDTAGAFGAYGLGVGSTDAGVAMVTGRVVEVVAPASVKIAFKGKRPPYVMAKDMVLYYIRDVTVSGGNDCVAEFDGGAVQSLSPEEKMTLCNMATEAAFVTGIIQPNSRILKFCSEKGKRPFRPVFSDPDAKYLRVYEHDASQLEPAVAKPHSPGNFALARDMDAAIDRAYIGSCTGGKKEDLLAAAKMLYGRNVSVETFIVPATMAVYDAMKTLAYRGKTLEEIFRESGALDGTSGELAFPGCQACLGGPVDTLGRVNHPMTVMSTTNRNFRGRMGSPEARIYLGSPLTVAASAIAGRITDPRAYTR